MIDKIIVSIENIEVPTIVYLYYDCLCRLDAESLLAPSGGVPGFVDVDHQVFDIIADNDDVLAVGMGVAVGFTGLLRSNQKNTDEGAAFDRNATGMVENC